MSPAWKKLSAFVLGLLFTILLAEAALRAGGGISEFLQERRNSLSLGRGGYRIMCLGESTTAGWDSAWPARLDRRL